MNRLVSLSVVALIVLACGGASPGATPPRPGASAPQAGQQTPAPQPTFDLGNLFGSPPVGATAAPTTEQIQIVNMYVPGDEAPYGFDIYILHAGPFGGFLQVDPPPNETPVAHADFGAVSAAFDPGSLDGSEAWAAYRAGKPATHDNLVWNFAQHVVDGGRSTVVMSSSDTSGDPAVKHLGVQVSYRDDKADPFTGYFTNAPGAGTIILDNSGLDAVWGDTSAKVMFAKAGDKCLDYWPSSPGQPQAALAGGPTSYANTPTGSVALIAYAHDRSQPDGCSGSPQTDPISMNLSVGGFEYAFVYSTDGTDLKGFAVAPLQ